MGWVETTRPRGGVAEPENHPLPPGEPGTERMLVRRPRKRTMNVMVMLDQQPPLDGTRTRLPGHGYAAGRATSGRRSAGLIGDVFLRGDVFL